MTTSLLKHAAREDCHPPDTGCPKATNYLHAQSRCVECPFESCYHETAENVAQSRSRERAALIRSDFLKGLDTKALSAKFNVCEKTVRKALWRDE